MECPTLEDNKYSKALAYIDYDTTGMVLVPQVRIEIEVAVDQGSLENNPLQASSFARSTINYQISDMTFDNLALIFLKYWRNSHDVDQESNLHILNHLDITCTKEYSRCCPIEIGDSISLDQVLDSY